MRHNLNFVKSPFYTSPCLPAEGRYAWPSDLMKRVWIALAAVAVIAVAAYAFTVGGSSSDSGSDTVDIPNDRVGSGIR